MKNEIALMEDDCGVYQFSPLPTNEFLQEYYANKYYQEASGTYATSYTEDEISWWKVRSALIVLKLEKILCSLENKSLLEVGCGEGWFLDAAHSKKLIVHGFDFSNAGISKWNPAMLPYFSQGNIYTLLDKVFLKQTRYDVIFIGNVIEHVLSPTELIKKMGKILNPGGVLVIVAPNDFSDLQKTILEKTAIEKQWWIGYPDHLSYFNSQSMSLFLEKNSFDVHSIVGDFPIEFCLFGKNTDYVSDKTNGKTAHAIRMSFDNYVFTQSPHVLLEVYEKLGSVGVGRNLLYYCKMK